MKVSVFPKPKDRGSTAVSRPMIVLGIVSFVASMGGVMLAPALLARVSAPTSAAEARRHRLLQADQDKERPIVP